MVLKGEAKTRYMREYMRNIRQQRRLASGPPGGELDELTRQKLAILFLVRVIEHYDPEFTADLPSDPNELVAQVVTMMTDEAAALAPGAAGDESWKKLEALLAGKR